MMSRCFTVQMKRQYHFSLPLFANSLSVDFLVNACTWIKTEQTIAYFPPRIIKLWPYKTRVRICCVWTLALLIFAQCLINCELCGH